ncbi:MAG: hypothetical protein ICV68_00685 [Pyrinomonadaceae bacterium]|nr:hypothetical protein [Pyrinomonadaceae bacterium]
MKRQLTLAMLLLASSLILGGCGGNENKPGNTATTPQGSPSPSIPKGAPLPDSAFKATISAVNPPETIGAGQQATLQVKLKNNSDVSWPSVGDGDGKYQVKLGNHWLDQNGKVVVVDDGRTPLPADLKPGTEIELPLTVVAPTKPGSYTLQIDIVQENVAWSQDKGNPTYKTKVTVK